MEIPNSKQQQLTFDKGITNVPSDAICPDNTLEECVGMVYDNNEYRPIQKPVEYAELPEGHTLLYVHVYGGFTRYITSKGGKLYWFYGETGNEIGTFFGKVSVESIGNTLILSDGSGMKYLLWDTRNSQPTYKTLGTSLPDVRMVFRISEVSDSAVTYNDAYHSLTELLDGIIVREQSGDIEHLVFAVSGSKFKVDKEDDAKSALIGLVAKRINQTHEAKRFLFPFWVRYAIRMYDGTYTYVSNPILMLPTVRYNWDIFTCDKYGNPKEMDGDGGGYPYTNYRPLSGKLFYEFTNIPNIQDWSDIIAGVDIFVSEEVKTLDMEGTWTIQNSFISHGGVSEVNPIFASNMPVTDSCFPDYDRFKTIATPSDSSTTNCYTYFQPSLLSDYEIMKKLLEASVFYKLLEIDTEKIEGSVIVDTTTVIERGVLENITSQTQLPDDYYSRAPMKANVMKAYNSRLHLANVRRGFFDGFSHFSFTCYNESYKNYRFFVYIKTDSGVRVVQTIRRSSPEIVDVWFYYPDPRAFKVMIFNDSDQTLMASLSLKEHPYLNGAYAFKRLPDDPGETRPATVAPPYPEVVTDDEIITDRLFVSEVNNPFTFLSKGDITIRMGGIIGLASQTMSLGEMEHGIHPLTVFSEKGISLLRLASDGTYTRSDEISREVCNNPSSITETDGPVFFSSEKGLMVVLGSDVKCVSEQLCGKTNGINISKKSFQEYLKDSFIAYDYRDSLLWVFNTNTGFEEYCYVYSIKTGTFSKYLFDTAITNIVGNYPDYLLQSGTKIYSLLNRPNINSEEEQSNSYNGLMITRPMKLENAFALKKLIQIMHVRQMEGSLSLRIFASNNLKTWTEPHSLLGTPWKYYKFQYDFTSLKATDRFAGTVVVTTEERTDKLR